MKRVDQKALRRAIRIARESDPARDFQITRKLIDESWLEVAEFAAYCCQCETLRLRPWQEPPCHMTDAAEPVDEFPSDGKRAAWELRRRLIGAGLSAFEPDPIAALAAIATTAA